MGVERDEVEIFVGRIVEDLLLCISPIGGVLSIF